MSHNWKVSQPYHKTTLKKHTNKHLTKEKIQPCGVIIQMTFVTFQGPELNLQFLTWLL